jgi:alkaline phosphatase D
MKAFFLSFFAIFLIIHPNAQILNGPMIGYVHQKEVALWVQTESSQKVQFAYRIAGSQKKWRVTPTQQTIEASAFTSKAVLQNLNPGRSYEYRVILNNQTQTPFGSQVFKTQEKLSSKKQAIDLSFAIGSCTYINEEGFDRPGKPYGGDYKIFEAIYQSTPDFMLWLGDNVYFREADLATKSTMIHRYTYSRNLAEQKKLLANIPQYAIWDDHDFGPNDSDGSFVNKSASKEVFDLFWANPPQPQSNAVFKGITNQFEWSDSQFFLLDNRYDRAPNKGTEAPRTILGYAQLAWLKDALLSSTATFKFIALGGQFLNTAPVFENYAANGFDKERQELIDFIYLHQIKNVVFLTGDRHHSELSILSEPGKPTIYDLTISPLTSGVHDASNEANLLRVPNSHVATRNYGLIKVSGKKNERFLEMDIYDSYGQKIWSTSIKAE